jgi:hypothetical protein
VKIARWLKGAKSYWLQRYEQSKILDPTLPARVIRNKTLDLEKIMATLTPHFENVGIRE